MKTVYRAACVALCLCSIGACAASEEELKKDAPIFADERANPYSFNRSIAYTQLRTGQALEATRVIQRLVELKPEAAEPYYMLGLAYLDLRQYEEAERALKTALHRDAEYARAQSMLGVLYDTVGRHGEAESAHKRAIQLAPADAGFRNNLGFSYYLSGHYAQAVQAYRQGLSRDMGSRRIHNNLAFAYGKLGNWDKAEEHFKLAGPPAQAWNNLAYLHEERDELELAYQYYLAAVEQDPLLAPARESLARVCERLGRPVPVVKVQSVVDEPQSPPQAAAAPTPAAQSEASP